MRVTNIDITMISKLNSRDLGEKSSPSVTSLWNLGTIYPNTDIVYVQYYLFILLLYMTLYECRLPLLKLVNQHYYIILYK